LVVEIENDQLGGGEGKKKKKKHIKPKCKVDQFVVERISSTHLVSAT
jgi:hypothetical protein